MMEVLQFRYSRLQKFAGSAMRGGEKQTSIAAPSPATERRVEAHETCAQAALWPYLSFLCYQASLVTRFPARCFRYSPAVAPQVCFHWRNGQGPFVQGAMLSE